MKADTESRPVLTPIENVATYDLVADQLLRAINLGRFAPGDKLPPERMMAEQLQVSRASVREAVRLLEASGILQVKKGATGGAVVIRRGSLDETHTENDPLEALWQAFEFRHAIEPNAARIAAEKRTKQELSELKRLLDVMKLCSEREGPDASRPKEAANEFSDADSQFHILIARMSRVPLFLDAVENIRGQLFAPVGTIFTDLRDDANFMHEALYEAIARKDSGGAYRAMSAHIIITYEAMRTWFTREK